MTGSPTALVYGLAIAGEATARALLARGYRVIAADDTLTDARRAVAAELGIDVVDAPDEETVRTLVRSVDLVSPSPGVPEMHPLVLAALALDVPLRTEIDLAHEWEQQRPGGPRPMIAITGTDGKTTTTAMVGALLTAGGLRVAEAGNTDLPLASAIDLDVDAFAVECSSFRLSWLRSFRAEAAIWLNLAPDHQNWHESMASYEATKANVWRLQRPSDVAVGWVDDPVVMRNLAAAPGRHITFGLDRGDYRTAPAATPGAPLDLVGPDGVLASSGRLVRRFPHDLSNAAAAVAACVESGLLDPSCVGDGLARFVVPPHRIEPLGEIGGVEWYNDSKATTPHAALTAIRSFDSVVLIAGGRNKHLDLRPLASEPQRMRAVVAIGDAAGEVADAFAGVCPIERVTTGMRDAVAAARSLARPGDAVLLSPACASFDWYTGYPARGDDFKALVRELADREAVA